MKLFPHQIKAIYETKQFNKVAVSGYEGLYEIDKQGNVFSILQSASRRKRQLSDYANGVPKVKISSIV